MGPLVSEPCFALANSARRVLRLGERAHLFVCLEECVKISK
jgi:hypothetical protein